MITVIALILCIIGSINWLLVGLIGFNLVAWITMGSVIAQSIIYTLVGLAGIWLIYYLLVNWKNITCREC